MSFACEGVHSQRVLYIARAGAWLYLLAVEFRGVLRDNLCVHSVLFPFSAPWRLALHLVLVLRVCRPVCCWAVGSSPKVVRNGLSKQHDSCFFLANCLHRHNVDVSTKPPTTAATAVSARTPLLDFDAAEFVKVWMSHSGGR